MPIFDFGPEAHIDTVWYVCWPDTDWMGVLYRQTSESPWMLRWTPTRRSCAGRPEDNAGPCPSRVAPSR